MILSEQYNSSASLFKYASYDGEGYHNHGHNIGVDGGVGVDKGVGVEGGHLDLEWIGRRQT